MSFTLGGGSRAVQIEWLRRSSIGAFRWRAARRLQSGVETLASRTCRPPPIGHTAVRTKTAGSYWTSTQQTMNPGGPLGHQNRRHTCHSPRVRGGESPSPEGSEDAVLNSRLLLLPVPLSPDRKHGNRIGNERKFFVTVSQKGRSGKMAGGAVCFDPSPKSHRVGQQGRGWVF